MACGFVLFLLFLPALSSALEVPMFPLRKVARLPTETVRLNLFEPRYLELTRDVMASTPQVFAAIYCGDAASVLPLGEAPATPMVRPGAVGVLCQVTSMEEDTEEKGVSLRAYAFSRCRVREVLQSPLSYGDKPYVVVDVSPLLDDEAQTEDAEDRAAQAAYDVERLVKRVWWHVPNVLASDDENDDTNLRYQVIQRFTPDNGPVGELERDVGVVVPAFSPSRRELYSFGLLSTLDLRNAQRVNIMNKTDTTDRFHYISNDLERGRNYLATQAGLSSSSSRSG